MTRIFLPPDMLTSNTVTITGDNARYLARVLRVQPGQSISVLDGQGYKYDCIIREVRKKEVLAEITLKVPYSVESPVSITLAQGIPKGEKMDFIIQKSTELGVERINPLITERSQIRHTEKIDRWRKIALSSSQQSGRDRAPDIEKPMKFEEFLKKSKLTEKGKTEGSINILFSELQSERNLKDILRGNRDAKKIHLLIGPEGGFAEGEIIAAIEVGFIEVSLGPRILRTETAPLAALSILQYELGDIS